MISVLCEPHISVISFRQMWCICR